MIRGFTDDGAGVRFQRTMAGIKMVMTSNQELGNNACLWRKDQEGLQKQIQWWNEMQFLPQPTPFDCFQ